MNILNIFKKKQKQYQLPDKLHELLQLALFDLLWIEKNPRYTIDMIQWHNGEDFDTCHVCMAGAVLAKTLNTPINAHIRLRRDHKYAAHLEAIDALREGQIGYAVKIMNKPYHKTNIQHFVPVNSYHDNRNGFIVDMVEMIFLLKQHNI